MVWFLSVLLMGLGFWIYILLWIFMPDAGSTPDDYEKRTGEVAG